MKRDVDYSKAIEIAENIYWVGMYLEGDPFQCHPYLILNGDESILIDPGSMLEFSETMKKVESITPISSIEYIVLHHQDPDLAAAVPAIEKLINREDLRVVTHSRMTVLIKHYLIQSKYYEIDKMDNILTCSNGLTLQFYTTPYCHSPGAFVSYEPKTKVLFSGDIFGGIEESWEFYASDDYFEKAKQFHAEYMPSKDIFNFALSKIEKLDTEIIAPQHGSIIQRQYIKELIEKMKGLDCGLYIDEKYNVELLDTIKELQVKDETIKARESQLFQQSKMAEMGEMIGNIAHQWRQPLSVINTIVAIMKEKNLKDVLEQDDVAKKLHRIENSISYMSETIEDFMHYYKPDKEKEKFSLRKAVAKSLEVVRASFESSKIEVHVTGDHSLDIYGYRNEYIQVIVSILSNAKDILNQRQVIAPKIEIEFYHEENDVLLFIQDNGGGIPEDIIQKVFDPYFTSKHQSQGTGLGLYISKMIIEQSMGGSLEVNNHKEGALFIIRM